MGESGVHVGGTVVDLFAGCGGLSLGLEQSGFEPVFVSELHADALSTYLANRPRGPVAQTANQASDILEITQRPAQLAALASRLRSEHGQIDLVVGGPPCQGYSGIGHRRTFSDLAKEQIPSNHLYREMARVITAVAPRAFVFENVKGLLSARWTKDGQKGEIWADVRREFERIEVKVGRRKLSYRIGWHLVHAKEYGVPQNRPRIILIGLREDVSFTSTNGRAGGLLPEPVGGAPDPVDILGDLVDPGWQPGGITSAYPAPAQTLAQEVMRADRWTGRVAPMGAPLTDHEYGNHSPAIVAKFAYMLANDGEIPEHMRTKKFAQRLLPERWNDRGPSITVACLADDYVHFSQPRVPTVREWARLQTFPDWYRFTGKRTTGGRRRAGDPSIGDWSRDVPKFTQIGNAVPVMLGAAIGEHLGKVLGIERSADVRDERLLVAR